MILNPDHITIAVANADPAIAFFALLGFRKSHVATIDGGVPARYMGMPDMKAQHITLVLEGASPRFEIQLLEFTPIPSADPGAHPTNLRRRGFNHLAFRVDDIDAVTAHLVANGVTMLSDEMDYISRKLRLFEGPEGITSNWCSATTEGLLRGQTFRPHPEEPRAPEQAERQRGRRERRNLSA